MLCFHTTAAKDVLCGYTKSRTAMVDLFKYLQGIKYLICIESSFGITTEYIGAY